MRVNRSGLYAVTVTVFLALAVVGCNTLGIQPNASIEQKAFEGVMIAMGTHYFTDVVDREPKPTPSAVAQELITFGDAFLSKTYPEYTVFGLCEAMASQISNGKFAPQVTIIYGIILVALDEIEERKESKRDGGLEEREAEAAAIREYKAPSAAVHISTL